MVERPRKTFRPVARGSRTSFGSLGRRRSSRRPRRLRLRSILRRRQTHQPQQVVRRARHEHLQPDFSSPHESGPRQVAHRLHPGEDLLDAFPQSLADRVRLGLHPSSGATPRLARLVVRPEPIPARRDSAPAHGEQSGRPPRRPERRRRRTPRPCPAWPGRPPPRRA